MLIHSNGFSGVVVFDKRVPHNMFWIPGIHPLDSQVDFEVSVFDKEPE